MPKIKNIIIFVAIGAALVLVYIFFFKKAPAETDLVSTASSDAPSSGAATATSPVIGQDFLSLLLNIKNIKLDDSIFSDPSFQSLHDSSILLVPDGTEGRPNPFAPIGTDISVAAPAGVTTVPTTPPAH